MKGRQVSVEELEPESVGGCAAEDEPVAVAEAVWLSSDDIAVTLTLF